MMCGVFVMWGLSTGQVRLVHIGTGTGSIEPRISTRTKNQECTRTKNVAGTKNGAPCPKVCVCVCIYIC